MSVYRKALWAAVLAGTITGCAAKPPVIDTDLGENNRIEESEGGGKVSQGGTDINAPGDITEDFGAQAKYEKGETVISEISDLGESGSGVEIAGGEPIVGAATLRELSFTAESSVAESLQIAGETDANIGVNLERGSGFSRLLLATHSLPDFDVKAITDPPRLVIDLKREKVETNKSFKISKDDFVKSVRIGAHGDLSRVVLDLTDRASDPSRVDYVIDTKGNTIAVTFHDLAQGATTDQEKIASASPDQSDAAVSKNPTAQGEDDVVVNEKIASQQENPLSVNVVTFTKTKNSSGQVFVGLSESKTGSFLLSKTAPSEFVLTIPDAQAKEETTYPQITPLGFPGIRSARAVQIGKNVAVRMFVDAGVELIAKPAQRGILVQAKQTAFGIGKNPNVRAQLEQGDRPAGDEEEKKLTGAAANIVKSPFAEDETAARAHPTGVESATGDKVYSGRLISLDLQDTDIDNALRIIAEVSNLNIIASEDVTGKVTLRLIDVPWDQALDVILRTNGLDSVVEGNVIRIAPVEKLRQEREALQAAEKARLNLAPLKVNYIRVSYARVTDLKEQVESVLSERGSIAVDERTNQLIIKDIGIGQLQASELIKKLDLRTPQVLLETQIVESTRSILRDLGFQWNFNYAQSPQVGNATGHTFPNTVTAGGDFAGGGTGNAVHFPAVLDTAAGSAITAILDSADGSRSLSARLSALEKEGKARVVSRPQVATVNSKQAEIKSVETVRVRLPDSGLSVATGSGASASGGGQSAFEEIQVGIQLIVTPQAAPDYYVLLDVKAKSSTFGSHPPVDNIPSTFEREATSTILVKSGQTFALGGVYRIQDNDDLQGVPFFKDIPVLGHFFRRSLINKNDEELIFFITPHIVEGSFDPSLM